MKDFLSNDDPLETQKTVMGNSVNNNSLQSLSHANYDNELKRHNNPKSHFQEMIDSPRKSNHQTSMAGCGMTLSTFLLPTIQSGKSPSKPPSKSTKNPNPNKYQIEVIHLPPSLLLDSLRGRLCPSRNIPRGMWQSLGS